MDKNLSQALKLLDSIEQRERMRPRLIEITLPDGTKVLQFNRPVLHRPPSR